MHLVDIDLALAQLDLGQFDLLLQLRVRLGDVIEGEDRNPQSGEEVASENDKRVKGELIR